MANWDVLKSAIADVIKTNGNQKITGQLLQNVLNNIISNVGLNSSFAGIATPKTNPGAPDGNVFYLATTAGTYSNFNGIVINSGEAVILEWKGNWVKKDSGFVTQEKLSELGSRSVYFEPTSKPTYATRVKELYLQGLKANKKYYAKYLQRIVSGTYVADQIHVYEYSADDKSDEAVVALCEDTTFSEGVVKITERGGSGISGYWVKHFKEDDYIRGTLTPSSDIVKDTVSSLAFSPSIANYLKSISLDAKFEEQDIVCQNRNIYFKDTGVDNWQNLIKELYLQGLKPNKEYYCKIQRYNANGHIGDELWLYEYDSDIEASEWVAVGSKEIPWDRPIRISQKNESGIFGFFIRNFDKLSDYPTQFSKRILINKEIVGNIENSPSIKMLYSIVNRYLLGVHGGYVSKLKELFIEGLDNSKYYSFKYFRRYEKGSYIVDQMHLYQYDDINLSNPKLVCATEDTTFSKGVVSLDEQKNSGIKGYIIKDITENDKNLDISNAFININEVSNIDNSPRIKEEKWISPLYVNEGYDFGFYRGDTSISYNERVIFVTYESSATNKRVLLDKITFGTNSNTFVKFGIGLLDQRNLPVIRETFTIECKKGKNVVSVGKLGLFLNENEQLFFIIESSDSSIFFNSWTSANNVEDIEKHQMLYGDATTGLKRHASTYGGSVALEWKTKEADSIFTFKDEAKEIKDVADRALSVAQDTASNIGFFTDRQGNKYKAVVVDGNLNLIPTKYKNIVVFCNSIGINGRLFSQGWCGNRGMASSKYGLDFFSHLKTGFKQKDSSAVVTLKNVWEWEDNFSYSYTNYGDVLTSDVDCIIFRAGENVKDATSFKMELSSFLDFCVSKCPSAEILITSMVWTNAVQDEALITIAREKGFLYTEVSANASIYKEKVCNYLYGDYTDDDGLAWDTSRQAMYKITGSDIANHTNDVGMLLIANNILAVLGYNRLDLLHSIAIGETNGYSCSVINTQWVEGGVVNVLSNGTSVSVTAKDGTAITVTNHNDGVFTFDMPSQDVTISVS